MVQEQEDEEICLGCEEQEQKERILQELIDLNIEKEVLCK